MKLFGKRTKKAVTKEEAEAAGISVPQSLSDGDRQVLELLKKDISTLNAKQRRMIKRYEERHGKTDQGESSSKLEEHPRKDSITKNEPSPEIVVNQNEGEGESKDDNEAMKGRSTGETDSPATEKAEVESTKKSNEKCDSSNEENAEDEMKKLKELLDKLNSKQRRTLSRRLDREGASALGEIRSEAESLFKALSEASHSNNDKQKETAATVAEAVEGGSKKRKRGKVDWSTLTLEERMRREDQRKKQQEAKERRENGEDAGTSGKHHKHPLNSERRRANRRKPKWSKKKAPSVSNNRRMEHNSSGFLHRKQTAQRN